MHVGRFKILRLFASKRVRYAVAAITLLFIVFMIVTIASFIQLTPQKLYDSAYIPFIVSTLRGVYQKPVDSTEINYEKGNYRAIVQMAKKKKTDSNKAELLLALSYLQLGQYSKSITHLSQVADRRELFSRDALFYLALAFLINQDYDKSIEKIEMILADPQNPYRSRFSESYIRKIKLLKWK